jgi:hypothetical protein
MVFTLADWVCGIGVFSFINPLLITCFYYALAYPTISLLPKTGDEKGAETMERIIKDARTTEWVKAQLTGNDAKDAQRMRRTFRGLGFSIAQWHQIVAEAKA